VNAPLCVALCLGRITGAENICCGRSVSRAMRVRSAGDTFSIVLWRVRGEECKLGHKVIAHASFPHCTGIDRLGPIKTAKILTGITSQLVPDLDFSDIDIVSSIPNQRGCETGDAVLLSHERTRNGDLPSIWWTGRRAGRDGEESEASQWSTRCQLTVVTA
jgi:hypothetical protein